MDKPPAHRPVWPWAVVALLLGWFAYDVFTSTRAMSRHTDDFRRLAEAGTAPGDRWLAQFRADPAAAHAAATAGFRRRVPAERLATLAVPDPCPLTVRSFGGGTVTTSLFGPAVVVPSRLILDGPGSLALEFVPDGDAIRLNAVTVNGAALSPPPG